VHGVLRLAPVPASGKRSPRVHDGFDVVHVHDNGRVWKRSCVSWSTDMSVVKVTAVSCTNCKHSREGDSSLPCTRDCLAGYPLTNSTGLQIDLSEAHKVRHHSPDGLDSVNYLFNTAVPPDDPSQQTMQSSSSSEHFTHLPRFHRPSGKSAPLPPPFHSLVLGSRTVQTSSRLPSNGSGSSRIRNAVNKENPPGCSGKYGGGASSI